MSTLSPPLSQRAKKRANRQERERLLLEQQARERLDAITVKSLPTVKVFHKQKTYAKPTQEPASIRHGLNVVTSSYEGLSPVKFGRNATLRTYTLPDGRIATLKELNDAIAHAVKNTPAQPLPSSKGKPKAGRKGEGAISRIRSKSHYTITTGPG